MPERRFLDQRRRTLLLLLLSLSFLLLISISGALLEPASQLSDLSQKNLSPSLSHPFGTDALGRDMLFRSLAGLSRSIRVGLLTAVCSAALSLLLAMLSALGGKCLRSLVSFLTDLVLGIPHILLLLLISYACGKGFWGVTLGVSLSHWPSLSRVLRAEILQVKDSAYVQTARKLGASPLRIVRDHLLPHIFPQLLAGLLLIFPHAILHEASITFLGFGLPPDQAAIGSILSESMQYLSLGYWWLALFPGLLLLLCILLFDRLGEAARRLLDPASAHL
ncbi:MAG: ABC transporter permease [Firmicutes bacterium]|nr:ABC transporter permease [Bacillota bacterium]